MMTMTASEAWRTMANRDPFVRAYIDAMLWTTDPEPASGEWCESDTWSIDKIDAENIAKIIADCDSFRALLEDEGVTFGDASEEQAGHDFFLTRNHHGAGFWDRAEDVYGPGNGAILTKWAHTFGPSDLMLEGVCVECGAEVSDPEGRGSYTCQSDPDHEGAEYRAILHG